MNRTSVLNWLGLPSQFGTTALIVTFLLLLAPHLAGSDFGIVKIPVFDSEIQQVLVYIGPVVFGVAILLHLPLLPSRKPVMRGITAAQIDDFCSTLSYRAESILKTFSQVYTHPNADNVKKEFLDLHKKHIQAFKHGNLPLWHELYIDIIALSRRMESNELIFTVKGDPVGCSPSFSVHDFAKGLIETEYLPIAGRPIDKPKYYSWTLKDEEFSQEEIKEAYSSAIQSMQ